MIIIKKSPKEGDKRYEILKINCWTTKYFQIFKDNEWQTYIVKNDIIEIEETYLRYNNGYIRWIITNITSIKKKS